MKVDDPIFNPPLLSQLKNRSCLNHPGRPLRVFGCPTHTKKFQIFSSYNNFFVCKKGKITVQPIFRGSENLRALYFFQEQLHFEVPHGQPFPMIQLVYAKIFQKKIYFHFNKKLLFQKCSFSITRMFIKYTSKHL